MPKPPPLETDLPYGPHPRNVMDFWRAPDGPRPSPVFVWIHGGGFMFGHKGWIAEALVNHCLSQGICVASLNYRLAQQAMYPAPMLDCARAVQFLRFHRERWDLDERRFAVGGSSAGGGISLWLGYHADLADPVAEDPIARLSSRPNCLVCQNAQCTYDPRLIREWLPGPAADCIALRGLFQITPERADDPAVRARIEDGSALTHVSRGAPPTFLFHHHANVPPSEGLSLRDSIHHPRFGEILKRRLDELGVPCEVRYREQYPDLAGRLDEAFAVDGVRFMMEHLSGGGNPRGEQSR